jgi:FKBP-type peptidyl-prolyl cis-trans isomerase
VEIRVQAIDAAGAKAAVNVEWIPSDPQLVSVSPSEGEQVTISVKGAGESSLGIHAPGVSKELAIKATSKNGLMQVEISQLQDTHPADPPQPVIAPAGSPTPGNRPLRSRQDKLSYALGANLGNGIRREAIEVDTDLLVQGLTDALSGSAPALTQHEISVAIAGLKSELTSKRITSAAEKIAAKKELAEKNKQESEAFLTANSAKDGVVTLDSGLQYRVLKAGNGKKPLIGDSVVCKSRGTLLDGTEFDSSYKRKQPVVLGLNEVIKGWKEALQLMPVASKWQLFVPPNLAYEERGHPGSGIGPNAALIFEIELVAIKNRPPAVLPASLRKP